MLKKILIILVRIFGWFLLVFSIIMVIGSIIMSIEGETEIGFIITFTIFGILGFLLTRYKKRKKLTPENKEKQPENTDNQTSPIPVKIQEKEEKPPEKLAITLKIHEEILHEPEDNDEIPAPPITDSNKNLFLIKYADYFGNTSNRYIEISGFKEENNKLYINAYCHNAKGLRQFLVDRVVSVSFDDQPVENPQEFLWEKYKKSDVYRAQEALKEHYDEILILVFLARADGKLLKNEREVIGRYIDLLTQDIDAEAIENMLKKTTCELAVFNKILKRAKTWKPEVKKMVLDAAGQIIALKKHLDPMENATFEKLKAAIG